MTTRTLRIAVADDEGFMRKYLQTLLPRLGHQVVVLAENGRELVERCWVERPDLVITDVNMPELDGLEAAAAIFQFQPTPIIVISGYHGPDVIERTIEAHVMAYLVKPIRQSDLEPVIALAMRRFEQMQSLRDESARYHDTLQDRNSIEQALQVLMNWAREGQDEALKRLEQMASDQKLGLGEIAKLIITADETVRADLPRTVAGSPAEKSGTESR